MPRELEVRRGFLTEGQLDAFLEAEPRTDYKLLWLLMGDCGLRISEALRVGLGELVGADHLRVKGKGRRVRHVGLTQRIRELVAALEVDHAVGPVFAFGKRSVQDHFKVVQARAGLADLPHLCPHSLRHTFATRLLVAGVDVVSVSALLGHTNLGTTMGYLHTNPEALRRAADALERVRTSGGGAVVGVGGEARP